MRKFRPAQAVRSWPSRWRVVLAASLILAGLALLPALLADHWGESLSLTSVEAAPLAQTCPTCPSPTPSATITTTVTPPTPVPPSPTKGVGTQPSQSEINGTITLDGTPAAGFTVTLDGRATASQVTGATGLYRFTGLPNGTYKVRVIYDPKKAMPVGQDYSDQAMDGTSVVTRNFEFKSVAPPPVTTAPPPATTAQTFTPSLVVVPNSGPPGTALQINGSGWNPQGPDGGPNQVTVSLDNSVGGSAGGFSSQNAPVAPLGTFAVNADGKFQGQATLPDFAPQSINVIGTDRNNQKAQAGFSIQATPTTTTQPNFECPNVAPPPGNGLRLALKVVQVNNDFLICMQAVAGSFGVDLSHTVGVTLPPGTTVARNQPSTGSVSVSGTDVDWENFTLAARASATLTLQVNNPGGKLDGSVLAITGVTSTGVPFRRIIPGLPPLTELNFDVPQGGGGTAPTSLPTAGNGQTQSDTLTYSAILALSVALVGLIALTVLLGRKLSGKKKA